MRVLIVGDDSALLEQIRQVLTGQRYIAETATNGEKALDLLFDTRFDAVILDIIMPKIDGLSVLEQVRKAGSMCRCSCSPQKATWRTG